MINYRIAKSNDIEYITKIHIESMPDYFTSKLGYYLLYNFYFEYFIENNYFFVACDDDKVIGFLMGHSNNSCAEKKWEKKNFFRILIKIFNLFICFDYKVIKRCSKELYNRLFNNNIKNRDIYYDFHFLSLAVKKEYRNRNIAYNLFIKMEQYFLSISKSDSVICTLGCYINNTYANKLYSSLGYDVYFNDKNKYKYKKVLTYDKL